MIVVYEKCPICGWIPLPDEAHLVCEDEHGKLVHARDTELAVTDGMVVLPYEHSPKEVKAHE